MKKCFVILQFGKPHEWMHQFFDNVSKLEKYGWYWKIFTPNIYFKTPSNVEIIPMDIEGFNKLVKKKTGIKPSIYITEEGIPSVHVTDFMVAYGHIFEDYLEHFDFWGMMGGPDIVFGRLDHFLPYSDLEDCDIFTDDPEAINGCFTLFRNREDINKLYRKIPNWKEAFAQPFCIGCIGGGTHTLYGTDEYGLTEVMKTSKLRYKHPKYYPFHGHDRLENHNIEMKKDGSLWELNRDTPPDWVHARLFFGREIMFYHFSQTKEWPILEKLYDEKGNYFFP